MNLTDPNRRRRLGLAVLVVGYIAHFLASLLLPTWAAVSVVCWIAALFGGALYCAETLKRLRAA